jgi:acetylornithine deacetylase/succinyl-diaminopimelate desuccinylase-like protein
LRCETKPLISLEVLSFMTITAEQYLAENREKFQKELFALLEIPSVSTDPNRAGEVKRCAEAVAGELKQAGVENIEIIATPGHPIVYADWLHAPGKPTVVIYGHYDVQPEDPIELWTSPPFQPTIRNGKVFARGATDDKGQMLAHIKAVETLLQSEGKLPVNVKFVIEGEEEIGSRNLAPFLEANKAKVQGDLLIVSDSAMFAPGMPSIVYGLRGLAYVQVDIKGADSDLHSGVFGGAVPNPAFELMKIVSKLKDDDGRINVPGFYDKVVDLSPTEREGYRKLPFNDEDFRKELNVRGLAGEIGYGVLEQRTARPTLEVNGMLSGWTGPGAKTVLPAKAMAKISCRLVPNQDPEEITELLAKRIESLCPPTVECTVTRVHGGKPWLTPIDHPALGLASDAVRNVFNTEALFVREGGSIPIVVDFERIFNMPGILVGFGLNSENLHAPDEHFDLENYQKGIALSAELLRQMARYQKP